MDAGLQDSKKYADTTSFVVTAVTTNLVVTRASNRIFFHFPVSEGYNRVDNRIANIVKIIG